MKAIIPQMGHYTEVFKYMAEELGFEYVRVPKINQEQIKLGVRHSSDMVCFPFKATLGNLIKGLEMGADTIIATNVSPADWVKETCRFGFYFPLQEKILKRLGYKFNMIYIDWAPWAILKIMRDISKKSGKTISYFKVLKMMKRMYTMLKEIEDKYYKYEPKDINIGIVGEAYTLWEEGVNYDIINKLKKMGCGVHMSVTLSWFLKHQIHLADEKKYLHKEVKQKYFPKKMGGHGFESVYNTLWYAQNKFDGIIHLLPLSCMPETTVEMSMNMIGEDYGVPIYRFPIDENNFEAGFQTRLETFIKLLRRNKNKVI